MGIFDKLFGRKKRLGGKFGDEEEESSLEDSMCKEKYKKENESELDNWIEKLEFIPEEYREELIAGLIRSLGPSEDVVVGISNKPRRLRIQSFDPIGKLACLCLIHPKNRFETELDENIKVNVRFLTTETPYDRPIIASYAKIFDSEEPEIDEYFHTRDKHLRIMSNQDHTYLIIAEPSYAEQNYKIYFRRKINFDETLREDLNKIKKAFERYGGQSGESIFVEDSDFLYAMQWYKDNVSMIEIDRKYF